MSATAPPMEYEEFLRQKVNFGATHGFGVEPGSHHPDVWHDVNRMETLNTEQSRRAQTMHVCPLQFMTVDRLINRYTSPGELVFDPFGGLATVPYRAVHLGRRGRAVELNPEYFRDGVAYLRAQERKIHVPSLLDVLDVFDVLDVLDVELGQAS